MNRHFRRLLLILVVTSAAALALLCWPTEPSYQGKRLSKWLVELDLGNSSDANAQGQAANAVRVIGTNALPRLTAMLGERDSQLATALIKLNAKQSFIHLPVTPASVMQARALQAYSVLGG